VRPLPGSGGVGGTSDRPERPLSEPIVDERARSPARLATVRAGEDEPDLPEVIEPLRTKVEFGAAKAMAEAVRGEEEA
jgi:hypothetical protein